MMFEGEVQGVAMRREGLRDALSAGTTSCSDQCGDDLVDVDGRRHCFHLRRRT